MTEKSEFKKARDKAIIYSMMKAGLRIEEVSDLKLNHLDMRQAAVTIYNFKGRGSG